MALSDLISLVGEVDTDALVEAGALLPLNVGVSNVLESSLCSLSPPVDKDGSSVRISGTTDVLLVSLLISIGDGRATRADVVVGVICSDISVSLSFDGKDKSNIEPLLALLNGISVGVAVLVLVLVLDVASIVVVAA
jgi:hypothetical protein